MALLSRLKPRLGWMSWHYRLGLVTCLGIILWGISGITHPVMSRLQPRPVAFVAPQQAMQLQNTSAPGAMLLSHGIQEFQRLALVELHGKPYFRVAENVALPARFFAASPDGSGAELQAGDQQYAVMLASHFTGIAASRIIKVRFVTSFSDSYPSVNRLLPVWEVSFDGDQHLRAYIDTDQARLATLTNDTSRIMAKIFRLGHNWSFLEDVPVLQLTVMALILSTALFSAGSGLYLYVRRRRYVGQRLAHRPLQRWHRRLGLLVSLSALLFAGSGLFHLIMSFRQAQQASPPIIPIFSSTQLSAESWRELSARPVQKLDLVSYQEQPFWLLHAAPAVQVAALAREAMHMEHHHEHHEDNAVPANPMLPLDASGKEQITMADLATMLAAAYANRPLADIVEVVPVTQFGGEYGFQFKRLPVTKVQFSGAGNPRFYVEAATGVLAASVQDADALEGWTFAYLHKWNFLDFNKLLRDALVMLFALGNVLVAIMGAVMFYRRSTR